MSSGGGGIERGKSVVSELREGNIGMTLVHPHPRPVRGWVRGETLVGVVTMKPAALPSCVSPIMLSVWLVWQRVA